MRHLAGSTILMLLLTMAGCGKPNPAGGGTPPARVLTQKEINDKHAANFLTMAKEYQTEGHPKYAVNTLKELLEQFPESEAADEAKQMLAEIEDNEPNGETSE